ncbi:MAG TPA: SPOR domain-containing protein [Desulfovibrio sp.]|jgi:cell division protein FtsN|nr:SPOR domain-containing protein [Desulfovibrio sp.]
MNQKKVPARKGEPRTYSYTFSLPQLVGLGGGLTAALTVFFVLGILIGRGYRPEAEVPELARIMPAPPAPGSVVQEEPKVLKPEELHYMEQLTQGSTAKAPKAEKPKAEEKPKPEAAKPEPKPEPAKAKADDKAKAEEKAKAIEAVRAEEKAKTEAAAKAEAAKAAKTAKAEAKVVNGEQVFDYVYQAAAFRERDQAQALARRVESTGLKASVESATENGTTWHRVVVLYRGTPSSTDTMREKLYSIGLGRPIMKSKQPAR